jgi:hypothetical protein
VSPTAAPATLPLQRNMAATPATRPDRQDGVIYCSWCGKQRAVNAEAIHHCGSLDRPAVYCMNCGTSLEEGAPGCTSCGTPATHVSR